MARVCLSTDAFGSSADTRFVYFDSSRRDLAARLLHDLSVGKGLLLLTGDTGSGKTTVLYFLADALAGLGHVVQLCPARVFRCEASTSFVDIARACHFLPSLAEPPAVCELAAAKLAQRLDNLTIGNRTGVLLVDDCDVLADHVLHQALTVFSLQADREGTISILLSGRAELRERLSRLAPHAVASTVEQAACLQPLDAANVVRMIHHRLNVAGRSQPAFFAPSAFRAIADRSSGNPGTIIRLCASALRIAELEQRLGITADLVDRAIEDESRVPAATLPQPTPSASSSALGWSRSARDVALSAQSEADPGVSLQTEMDLSLGRLRTTNSDAVDRAEASASRWTAPMRGLHIWISSFGGRPRSERRLARAKGAAAVLGAVLLGVGGAYSLASVGAADSADRPPVSTGQSDGYQFAAARLDTSRAALSGLSADQFIEARRTYDYPVSPEAARSAQAAGPAAAVVLANLRQSDGANAVTITPGERPQQADAAKAGPVPLKPLDELIISVRSADRPEPVYTAREELTFSVGASRDAFVNCFYQDNSTTVTQVFPSSLEASAFVPAGRQVSIPGEGSDFGIVLDRPGSTEEVMCVGRSSEDGSQLAQAFEVNDLEPLPVASLTDLLDYYRQLEGQEVASARMQVIVAPARQ